MFVSYVLIKTEEEIKSKHTLWEIIWHSKGASFQIVYSCAQRNTAPAQATQGMY